MKKNRYSISYILIASILTGFIGCSGKVKENKPEALLGEEEVFDDDALITIQLSGSKKYEHTFKFTDIVKQVDYIPLETTEDCLLGERSNVERFTEDFIFVKSNGILFQFDRQGKFIRKINRNGQGPGECYARCSGFDENNRLIYILDNGKLSLNIFDFDGQYIKTIQNPFSDASDGDSPSHMGCDSKGNILWTCNTYPGIQMMYKYIATNGECDILHQSPNYTVYELKEKGRGVPVYAMYSYPIYEYNSCNYYPYTYNDTIFRINDDYSSSPARIIHIPNRVTLEEYKKACNRIIDWSDLDGKNDFSGIRENRQHVYIYHSHTVSSDSKKHNYFVTLYNKQTGKLPDNYKIEDLRYFTEAINCHCGLDPQSPESKKFSVNSE